MSDQAGERLPINIEDEMKRSYLDYAMSVIVGRALPDVRDGLKPVHRRVLFGMYDLKNFHNQAYKKSARVVGDVIGKYHPHGDTAVYDALVRMAQDFSLRYLLADGQGNFGSVDGDSPAAMRYTEVRLTALAGEMLRDLDKETVDFTPNYDGSMVEPTVMPAPFPNLLVNGSSGIAVGMATNMPSHNLREVIDACQALIEDPTLSDEALLRLVPGPDFPTGAIILGTKGIREAYMTGRGKVRIRAKTHFEGKNGSDDTIIVDELPYQVNKARLLEQIAELVKDKKIEGIRDLRDESDRQGMRMVIELKRDAIAQVVLNQLFQSTQLQTTFGVLNLAIVDGRPEVLPLRKLIEHFVNHRRDVVTRRCLYELREKKAREHILEGLIIALDNIDEIVALIRASATPDEARAGLMARFGLSERQATAILEMRLQRLTGLERDKLHNELAEVRAEIARLEAILASETELLKVISGELAAIREKYGDDRRTVIQPWEGDLSEADLIADDDVIVTLSHTGYIKRTQMSEYQTQKRGGSGKIGATTKEEDWVTDMFATANHDLLLIFTNTGRVYGIKVYEVPEGSRQGRGKPLPNLIDIQAGETARAILPIREFTEGKYLLFATRRGVVKKTDIMSYSRVRANGLIAIDIQDGDDLVSVKVVSDHDVMLTTRNGYAIRFGHDEVRSMGRDTRGVTGARFRGDDEVVSMELLEPGKEILIVSENGYGKRTPIDQYRRTKRGAMGIITMATNERNGGVAGVIQVDPADQAMIITDGGMIIRFKVGDVRVIGRAAQGVRLVRLREGEKVTSIERIVDPAEEVIEKLDVEEPTEELTPEELAALEAEESSGDGDAETTDE